MQNSLMLSVFEATRPIDLDLKSLETKWPSRWLWFRMLRLNEIAEIKMPCKPPTSDKISRTVYPFLSSLLINLIR